VEKSHGVSFPVPGRGRVLPENLHEGDEMGSPRKVLSDEGGQIARGNLLFAGKSKVLGGEGATQ